MLQIIQNDPKVPPGILTDTISVPFSLCRADLGELLPTHDQTTALIVLGGAMGANDDAGYPFLADLKDLIRTVVEQSKPYLGICLGGQLLAAALGAAVVSNRWEELGTRSISLTAEGTGDPLFTGILPQFTTFQWHHDSFDLPEGAVLLATSAACFHQAFRYGLCAWGLQFHPEVTEQIIRDWCAWGPATAQQTNRTVADFTLQVAAFRQTTKRLTKNFTRFCS